MYKWPQGRIIRTIGLVLGLVIGLDLGSSAYSRFQVYFHPTMAGSSNWSQLVVGGVLGLAALSAILAALIGAGFHHAAVDFLIEVEQEMTRVTWPSGSMLVKSTLWIAIMIVVLSGGIFLVDAMNFQILKYIRGL